MLISGVWKPWGGRQRFPRVPLRRSSPISALVDLPSSARTQFIDGASFLSQALPRGDAGDTAMN